MGHRCHRSRLALLTLGAVAAACESGTGWRGGSGGHPIAVTADAGLLRGPYLQLATPTSAVVRWRTSTANDSRVSLGASPTALDTHVDVTLPVTDHEVSLHGLTPATRYYYSVGTAVETLAGGAADQFFVTPPPPGTDQPVRLWAFGDSGTANVDAAKVRDAYRTLTGGLTKHTDVWLMLGDNAYPSGLEHSYQRAVFDMYPMFLRQTFLWPTIGNHDTGEEPGRPAGQIAFLDIFTLPTGGEAGGLPSGTERYYSFDHADVHFICLDSMTSDRRPGGPMLTWLEADLRATTRRWIVAYWHHPPYSRGNHNSDYAPELIEMRRFALPILESHGVDLVLSGHSHAYERSFLLDGHYGLAETLGPAFVKDRGSGRAADGVPYRKTAGGRAAHEGAVYVVAGSGGQVSGGPLDHPAMFVSLNRLGSLVVDIDGGRLEARFLRENGFLDDSFTLLKGPQANALPRVLLTGPANDTRVLSARISLAATASDPDGRIARVDFFADHVTALGSDDSEPYQAVWNATPGEHQLVAVATDDRGATVASVPVTVTVPEGVGFAAPAVDAAVDAPADAPADALERPAPTTDVQSAGVADAPTPAPTPLDRTGWRGARSHRGTNLGCGLAGPAAQTRSPGWPWLAAVLGALAHRRAQGRGRSGAGRDRP